MTSWRRANRLRVVDGTCHICKQPADGRKMFQTRFCDLCLKRGMDLEYGVASKYAIIPTLYKIQTTYDDLAQDIVRAINSLLPPVQNQESPRDKMLEEESWPNSSSLSIGRPVNLSRTMSRSVDSVPLPPTVVKTTGTKAVSG